MATSRLQSGLAVLVLAQAAHSLEECLARMWESHAPARFVAGLISADLARGFFIANALIVAFGLWCVLWPVRRHWRSADSVAWFWVGLECVNVVAHSLWSLLSWQYTPGLATVPLLILSAWNLAVQLQPDRPGR